MKRILLTTILISFFLHQGISQTKEEIKAQKEALEGEISAKKDTLSRIEGDIANLQGQVDALPGWHIGGNGTLGINISKFKNWFQKEIPNSDGGAIGITVNGFANYDDPKQYWRTAAALNLGWVKFDDQDDPNDDDSYRQATDIFNIASLYGRKLSKTLAATALIEYRSSILNDFNDPGYLDLGIGATWEPAKNLFIVVHPLNANIIFSEGESVYESTMGAKIVVDYSQKFKNGISFKSNLSSFLSYEDSNRSNWTWTNSFSYTLWKNIGIGLEAGLRGNKQETLDYEINVVGDDGATFDTIDNELQSYFLAGISYKF
ncbi:MAG: hypothetical protein DHS20C17_17380 [Cyclobacteriaceae bacterium]|nr:MAG: hypothetical protein DHS20C17_17380 [Cyclobacteriaceae bacterium]